MNEMNEFEYTVAKKVEGSYRTKRILMIVLYVVFGLVYFFGLAAIHMYPLMALIIFFEWMLVFFTWRYVCVEYSYSIISGNMTFYEVYGGKKKKLVLEKRVKSFAEIKPLDESEKALLSKRKFNKIYSFVRSENYDNDTYFAIFTEEDGSESIVYFEAIKQSLKILKYYNSNTVVSKSDDKNPNE